MLVHRWPLVHWDYAFWRRRPYISHIRKLNDIISQLPLIGPALWNLSLCQRVPPQSPAGTTLRHTKFLSHMINALTATRRAQKFPQAVSARINLSSVRSDTARRSRWLFDISLEPMAFDATLLQLSHRFNYARPYHRHR